MNKVPKKIEVEIDNVREVLRYIKKTAQREKKTVIELAALATFVHSFYNGVENILKQALISEKLSRTAPGQWHKELLEQALSKGVINEDVAKELYEYLTFRHFFVHGYGFRLEEEPLMVLVDKVNRVWKLFLVGITKWYE